MSHLTDTRTRIQIAAQRYHESARRAWDSHVYTDAIRFRAMAEGLEYALELLPPAEVPRAEAKHE